MCCGAGRVAHQIEIPAQYVEGEGVLVRYFGRRGGTFTVTGKVTKTPYTFNNGSQAIQTVNERDAEYILSLPKFSIMVG